MQKSIDRSGRPMCIDVHRTIWLEDRSTARELCSLEMAPVNRAVDRQRASALCFQASVNRPVDRWHNGRKFDRWPIDRAVDRHQIFSAVLAKRIVFVLGYKYPLLWTVLDKFLESKNFHLYKCLTARFKRVFGLKDLIFICFKVLEFQRK